MRLNPRHVPHTALATAALVALMGAASPAQAQDIKSYFQYKKPKMITLDGDLSFDTNGKSAPVVNAAGSYLFGFEGISQYDGASFGRSFVPPDTMGAVGRTQYMETSNGAYAVFDKATGNRTLLQSDVAWWAAAGQVGANGDSRVMYNAAASRWVAISFGASVADIQIAVSDTDNALGGWKSTKFTGFVGGTADYPTLALDKNAVYIGTNNFKVGCSTSNPAANAFCGTTLNVIPLKSVFNAGAPTVNNMQQFVTPLTSTSADRGFAIQGVNSSSVSTSGTVVAASLFAYDNVTYRLNGLTANSALAATQTSEAYLGMASFTSPSAARQPSVALAGNRRVLDAGDERISSSAYEWGGKVYMVNTVDSGSDEARVRYTVMDASSQAILDEGDIGYAGFDFYQGSIAVNAQGAVVIGYNRSGLQQADGDGDGLSDGNVTFMARTFWSDTTGQLHANGAELKLKVSLIDDYHNGSDFGNVAVGRQRWGDYSQVSVDPSDADGFWLVGEFAREYNNTASGHPGGTGGSRWGTFIAQISAPVPEPSTYGMLALGLLMVGVSGARRRRQG